MNNFNKKKLTKILTLISLFLILIPFIANAELAINTYSTSTDFAVYVPGEVEVCSCDIYNNELIIQNTGAYQTTFFLSSDNPELISFPVSEVLINKGDQLSVPYAISTDCDFNNEYITLYIKNSLNVEKEFIIHVQGINCQNLAATVAYEPQVLTPCSPINFELEVINIADFTDTYYFDFGEFSEYAFSDYGSVILQPNQIGNFNVTLNLPCNLYGNYTLPVNIYTIGTVRMASFNNDIEILKKYDFSTDFTSEIFACSEGSSLHTFNLINEESFNNTFKIKSLYPDFVKVKTTELVVAGNSQKQVDFIVTGSDKRIGYHDVGLVITSELGNIEKTLNSKINMGSCHDIEIIPEYEYYNFCGREADKVSFKVKNNAVIEQEIKLDVTQWGGTFTLSNYSFILGSGEEETVFIDLNTVPDENKLYKIPIVAKVLDDSDYQTTKLLTFDFLSSYECHKTIIDPTYVKVNYDANKSWFKISNLADRQLDYNVSIIPSNQKDVSWIDYPSYPEISLNSSAEDWVTFNFNEKISNISQDNYKFNVTIIPINSIDGISYNYVFTVALRDKSFIYYVGLWITTNPLIIIGIILLLLFLLLLLYLCISRPKNLGKKKKRKKSFKKFLMGYIVLMLLLLILLLIFCPLKSIYPALNENTQLNWTMYSGDTKKIDMTNYFNDPDNDNLSYFVKLQEIENQSDLNFSVTFEDSIALINAEKEASGIIPFWFYATDGDYFIKSSMFILRIVEKPTFTFSDYVNFYVCYIVWLIVLIILGIYIIALSVWANKRTKRQVQNSKK